MTGQNPHDDDLYRQMDNLQLRSRERINRTLPVDPVADFEDLPAPGDGAPDDSMFNLDMSFERFEPDVAAAEADPFQLEQDLADVAEFEVDLPGVEDR